jgi:hypothetical protein
MIASILGWKLVIRMEGELSNERYIVVGIHHLRAEKKKKPAAHSPN